MKYYRFSDSKLFKIGFFLYLLLLQMMSRSTMYSSTLLGYYKAQYIMLGLVGLGGAAFLMKNRRDLKQILLDHRMLVVALFAAVILGPMVLKRDWQMLYITLFVYICVAVFFSYFLSAQELSAYYVVLMTVLGAYAVLGQFVLKEFINMGILPAIRFDNPGGWDMYNLGLTFAVDKNTQGHDTMRVFGIFREPGIYQCFLFVAIHLNNYIVQWKKNWHCWLINAVLWITLITTFATGGVFALGLYIVFLFFDKGLYRQKRMRILVASAVSAGILLIAVALVSGGTWAYELVGMVEKVYNLSYSLTARTDAVAADMKLFFAHPLLGARLEDAMHAVYNNATTSPIVFAGFGIFGGCLHVLTWAALIWKKERHWIMNLILLGIVMIPFNTQNMVHDMFMWMFPVAALTECCCRWLEDRKNRKENS